ncbi:Myosin-cross-reactive_antigen [Hexamita inflata]|uniref:Putative n=1 Tax=Hexamita inflata TaxID=28002 RepID=A0AA86R931_9EUKA|nr:Myosin-cross-reactive antigen [Hexamita inflata]
MTTRKAYFVGSGVGSMTAAFFLMRDAGFKGEDIKMLETLKIGGGSCDGTGSVENGFITRGGRMFNFPTFECTWEVLKEIPSNTEGKSVYQETVDFNRDNCKNSKSRVVDKNGCRLDVQDMGFTMSDRMQLLKLVETPEEKMGNSIITDWFSPRFFETNFWIMWATTFAFQPWHSAIELKRYMERFMHEFVRIETLEGIKSTVLNQYDSMIVPLQKYLMDKGVSVNFGCTVEDVDMEEANGKYTAKVIHYRKNDKMEKIELAKGDLLFIQNGCMTDASTLGSWTKPAELKGLKDSTSFKLWDTLAQKCKGLGNAKPFMSNTTESIWQSFTVTMKNPALFKAFTDFYMQRPGIGGIMTFKDSNWFMGLVIAEQPHFAGQPKDVNTMWGYGLFPNKIGNYVNKSMLECTGEEIFYEYCQHCRIPPELVHDVTCIPCIMPFITAQFMPRQISDRPKPVPDTAVNFGFISQFVEIPYDTVFTVEYSTRAAQTAVYGLCGIKKKIPKVHRYHKQPKYMIKAVKKAFMGGAGTLRQRESGNSPMSTFKKVGLAAVIGFVAFAVKKGME